MKGQNSLPMSKVRKAYFFRLFGRIAVLTLCVGLYFAFPQWFEILDGWNFFRSFSVFHILWVIWLVDMIFQLVPVKNHLPLGSQKHIKERFRPVVEKINYEALRKYVVSTTRSAYKVLIFWGGLIFALGVLRVRNVLNNAQLFLICVLFYVCDLVCVLIWCPFRLIMKNKCCTTCRIFNWDHLMMFTPLLFVRGFFSYSLILLALAVWIVWELCVAIYPERFWEGSNVSLQCSECTDKLCTQYCRKLRNK